jgi:hypothetical protein
MFDQNWFKITVFNFPPALFAVATVPYACKYRPSFNIGDV